MFKIKPEEVKCVFIVKDTLKQNFLEWIYSIGFQSYRYDWNKLIQESEERGNIILLLSDGRIPKLINKLNLLTGVHFWLIGCPEIVSEINPFSHYMYTNKEEWQTFLKWYENKQLIKFNL